MRPNVSASVLTALLLTVLLGSSCEVKFDWSWNKSRDNAGQELKTTGQAATEDRTVPAFTRVKLEGLGQLVFDPSVPAGTVRVTADQGLLPAVRTTVEGGTLRLREEGAAFQGPGSWNLEYRVAPGADLSEVTLSGLGSITAVSALSSSADLTLALDGMGRIDLEVAVGGLTVRQQGQGDLQVRGTARSAEVRADGLGRVDLGGLTTPETRVESNGLGEVTVFASEKLRVRANGMGAVRFKGHPTQTDVQTQGMTQVTAAD